MKNRKVYVDIMEKLLKAYKSGTSQNTQIDKKDYHLIDEMIELNYLNETAFAKFESSNVGIIDYHYKGKYPITQNGKEFLEMGWYQILKQSGSYQLIRDIAAFIGAVAGIIIGIISVIKD